MRTSLALSPGDRFAAKACIAGGPAGNADCDATVTQLPPHRRLGNVWQFPCECMVAALGDLQRL